MCGIVGVLLSGGAHVEEAHLIRMTRTLAHRGPDAEGVYCHGPVGLGHRRLSILDLSDLGRQPLGSADGKLWITFNGEIYNFQEIRSDLMALGHRFVSQTDTEVILHAYAEWGEACLERLNGMFAFGLWDENQQSLWLVRDRLGVKPLFVAHTPHGLVFGSEIKALLASPWVSREVDHRALAYFLALNYTPAPYTLFKNVRQVMPGQWLKVTATGQVATRNYWDFCFHEGEDRGEAAYAKELSGLLESSVSQRLVSDVPLGVFLSGGVDSSTVAWWMNHAMHEPVKSFSVHFGEKSFDEDVYAKTVAEHIGAQHHQQLVRAEAAELLPAIVAHAEEPTADSSMVAVYYLCKSAREHVTVALSGDGADEIFAGYETYAANRLLGLWRRLPGFLRRGVITPLIHALPHQDAKMNLPMKLRRFLSGAERPDEEAHASWRMIFDETARQRVLAPLWSEQDVRADVLDLYRDVFRQAAQAGATHPLNRQLYVDTRFYLPNDMLVKVDRMSMMHALEVREPMLDYRLVEFSGRLPPHYKLRGLNHKKYLLKKVMSGKLPHHILHRKKAGFNVPNARWMKKELRPFVTAHLHHPAVADMGMDPAAVRSLLEEHFQEKADHSHQLWGLLTLSLWWQKFQTTTNFHGA